MLLSPFSTDLIEVERISQRLSRMPEISREYAMLHAKTDHGADGQLIWIATCLPSIEQKSNGSQPMNKSRLTAEKKKLIRVVVAFVVATKHHLRAEGGVHHEDLKGMLSYRRADI